MKSGRYRDLITVIRLIESPTEDPLGPVRAEVSANWSTYTTFRGERLKPATRTNSDPSAGIAAATHRWKTRYNATAAAIGVTDQLTWQNKLYHITAVETIDHRNRELLITAVEIVGATPPAIVSSSGTFFGSWFGPRFFGSRYFG